MDDRHISRVECRKCGAILPGPIEICPICYAEQSREPTKRGGYKIFLLWGFIAALAIAVVVLAAKL